MGIQQEDILPLKLGNSEVIILGNVVTKLEISLDAMICT